MPKYDINLKNDTYFTVEVEEDAKPPKLDFTNGVKVTNLPEGYSVDPTQVLYIEPSED